MNLRTSIFSALLLSSLLVSGCSTVHAPTSAPAASPSAVAGGRPGASRLVVWRRLQPPGRGGGEQAPRRDRDRGKAQAGLDRLRRAERSSAVGRC